MGEGLRQRENGQVRSPARLVRAADRARGSAAALPIYRLNHQTRSSAVSISERKFPVRDGEVICLNYHICLLPTGNKDRRPSQRLHGRLMSFLLPRLCGRSVG